MFRRIIGEIPEWAKLENPLLRYEILRNRPERTRKARLLRVITWAALLVILVITGAGFATKGFQRGLEMPYTLDLWRALFFPLFTLQLVLRAAGISLGVTAVSDERRRQTWDNLRSTERGAEMAIRTRWIGVLFYRLRSLLVLILAGRAILITAVLYELTSMQGLYLDILSGRSIPGISLESGVMLLAALMTAVILMPITATGVDVAAGLFIGSAVKGRTFTGVLHVFVILLQIVPALALLLAITLLETGGLQPGTFGSWLLITGFAALGDWGLSLMQLTHSGQLWAAVPYSVFISAILMLVAFMQILLANALIGLSAKAAEHNE